MANCTAAATCEGDCCQQTEWGKILGSAATVFVGLSVCVGLAFWWRNHKRKEDTHICEASGKHSVYQGNPSNLTAYERRPSPAIPAKRPIGAANCYSSVSHRDYENMDIEKPPRPVTTSGQLTAESPFRHSTPRLATQRPLHQPVDHTQRHTVRALQSGGLQDKHTDVQESIYANDPSAIYCNYDGLGFTENDPEEVYIFPDQDSQNA